MISCARLKTNVWELRAWRQAVHLTSLCLFHERAAFLKWYTNFSEIFDPRMKGWCLPPRALCTPWGSKLKRRSQKKVKVLLARKKQSRSPTTQGSVRPRLGAADGPTKHLTIGSLPYKDMQILFHPIRYIRQRSSLDNNSPAGSWKSWILGRSDTSVPHTS